MPEVSIYAAHIINMLFRAGVVANSGMGPVGLPWAELQSWAILSGGALSPFEFEAMKEASGAYAAMLDSAKSANCPPPWVSDSKSHRDKVSDKIGQIFKGVAKKT